MARHEKGMRTITRNVLVLKETLALNAIVVSKYTESKMSNTEFAEWINSTPEERSKFRFDLSPTHILTALAGADIPANKTRVGGFDGPAMMVIRVQELEEQMTRVLKRLEMPPRLKD